jgi:hypothetical protein
MNAGSKIDFRSYIGCGCFEATLEPPGADLMTIEATSLTLAVPAGCVPVADRVRSTTWPRRR